jgi:hypothetical protein
MSTPNVMAYRRRIANQLTRLSNILYRTGICDNIEPINEAARALKTEERVMVNPLTEKGDRNIWGYDISDLTLKFKDNPKHIMPTDIYDLVLKLNVTVYGELPNLKKIQDPFIFMGVSIILSGSRAISNGKNDFNIIESVSSIHLDRDKGEKSDEPHPSYHFQFGGKNIRNLKKDNDNFGHLMVLDIPRINHYPMEGILAVDFVLSNFFHEVWNNLIQDGEYSNLVREQQKLCMKPYFQALANKWNFDSTIIDWNNDTILPQLQ